jgi:SsrA-binding protein
MLIAKNRKAFYEHEILDKFIAGISLQGYEVKALREGKVNMDGSYVQILGGNPVVVNMHIGPYSKQSQKVGELETRKTRKLLLNKNEIEKISRELSQKGKTAIPLALILSHNMIKLELGIAKGRRKEEKKHLEKERQIQKDLQQVTKEISRQ